MKNIRIAIVEDEEIHRDRLFHYLEEYEGKQKLKFQIDCFRDGIDLLEEDSSKYDLIFLDIQMKFINGIETAQKIREKNKDVVLFFVTSFAQHATEGYDVDAKGFVVKPVNKATFFRQLDRIFYQMEQQSERYLLLNNSREMLRVNMKDIRYIESTGHYVNVYTDSDTITYHISLKEIEKQTEGTPLFRCSSSCIVNIERIDGIVQHDLTIGDTVIAVSRSKKKALMDAMNRYYGNGK